MPVLSSFYGIIFRSEGEAGRHMHEFLEDDIFCTEAVAFLSSEDVGIITGELLNVSDGLAMG